MYSMLKTCLLAWIPTLAWLRIASSSEVLSPKKRGGTRSPQLLGYFLEILTLRRFSWGSRTKGACSAHLVPLSTRCEARLSTRSSLFLFLLFFSHITDFDRHLSPASSKWGRTRSKAFVHLPTAVLLILASWVFLSQLACGQIASIVAGHYHYCVIMSVPVSSGLRCWGQNTYGQLGYGNSTDISSPPATEVSVPGATVLQATGGMHHTCILTSTLGTHRTSHARARFTLVCVCLQVCGAGARTATASSAMEQPAVPTSCPLLLLISSFPAALWLL